MRNEDTELNNLYLSLKDRAIRNSEVMFAFSFNGKLFLAELKNGKWSDPIEIAFYKGKEELFYMPISDEFVGIDKEIGQALDEFCKATRSKTPKRKRF